MIEVKHIETREDGEIVDETFEISHEYYASIRINKEEAQELYKLLGEKLK